MTATLRPKQILDYYSKIFPDAWMVADNMRSSRGRGLPIWPEWCFLPINGAYAIVSEWAMKEGLSVDGRLELDLVNEVGVVNSLAAWRYTQGVYRFDPDVFAAVTATKVTGELPGDILLQMPEWSLYVETPSFNNLNGFFCGLVYSLRTNKPELMLIIDNDNGSSEMPAMLQTMPVRLGDWSLEEAILKTVEASKRGAKSIGLDPSDLPEERVTNLKNMLEGIISLIVYICSVKGEVGTGKSRPQMPKPKKTKKGEMVLIAGKPKVWEVGMKTGEAIRKAAAKGDAEGSGAHAHWHGQWVESKSNPEEKRFEVKWLLPILED